ncbi:hypothetical protein ACPV5P_26320 [Vibrio mediterranei]|uniref:hypothetical protein n=1 Tax=Vibrio mediterranei TaxID=689 RepID=UPI004067E9C3
MKIVAAVKIEYKNRLGALENKYFLNDRSVELNDYDLFISNTADRFPSDISELSVSELLRTLPERT